MKDGVINFFKTITSEQYIGWILLGIVVLVIIIFCLIALHYSNKKKKAKQQALNYKKNEIANLSDEEIKNIANNVADPQTLYKKIEEHKNEVKAEIDAENEKNNTTKKPKNVKPKKNEKPVTTASDTTTTSTTIDATTTSETTTTTDDTATATTPKKSSYLGKWKIKEDDGKFFAELYASNGVLVLKTEYYKSVNGVKNGIETIKKNVVEGNFATSVDKSGRYCFKLFSKTNRLICVSDYYSSKAKCEGGINSVKRFAETANIIREENNNQE